MTLQLQAGKTYVTRNGLQLGPMLFDGQSGVFHLHTESLFDTSWCNYWTKNGIHRTQDEYFRIVAEYVDKSAYLQKGMWYKYPPRIINQGHLLSAHCIDTTEKTAIMKVFRSEDPDDYFVNIVDIASTYRRSVPSTQPAKPQEDF